MTPAPHSELYDQFFRFMEVIRQDAATSVLTPAEKQAVFFLIAHYTELPTQIRPLVVPLQARNPRDSVGVMQTRSAIWKIFRKLKELKATREEAEDTRSRRRSRHETPHVKIGRLWGEAVPVEAAYRRRGDSDYIIRRFRGGKIVGIPDVLRNKAVYIIGKSGTGKSTVAEMMAIQDIRQGKGVAFIDPHGDQADSLLDYIPAERLSQVIYFEPRHYPAILDLLDAKNDDEINELASDIYNLFTRLSAGDIGPQMGTILKFALHAMIRARRKIPVTFMNLEKFLTSENYRDQCLRQPGQSTRIRDFWHQEYPAIKGRDYSAGAVLRRITDIRLSPILPTIFGDENAKSGGGPLNLQEIMDQQKILIVNLGGLTEEDRRTLGTCLITKIQLVLPRRKERIPFYLYVDELDEFASSPFQKIITKCRKFNINLTLMNQGLYQIKQDDNKRAIKSIDAKVIFRIDEDDARYLRSDIAPFESEEATRLRTIPRKLYEAFYHSPLSGTHLIRTFPIPAPRESHRNAILANMRNLRVRRPSHTRAESVASEEDDSDTKQPPSETL
jgi:hypothetical protein